MMETEMITSRRLTAGLVMAALLLASGAAWSGDQSGFRAGPLKVVTQNLYVGGDILLPLSVPPADFPAAAAEVVEQILATRYPERAMQLADLIRHEWPHLVGLQEVYVIRICLDEEGDVCPVDYDYLQILLDNLNERSETYLEVATVTNIDLPNLPATLPGGTPVYVSITDRDVILAHRFVQTANPSTGNYLTALPVNNPLLPPGFSVLRGYAMVDAAVLNRSYRFVNTHLEVTGAGSVLEPFFRAVQAGQALELVTLLQQEDQSQVVVGDFNSDPFDGPFVECAVPDGPDDVIFTSCPTPYAILSGVNPFGAVYTDTWLNRNGPFELGYTCCQSTLLDNETSGLDERVDLIWARQSADYIGPPFLSNVRADVFGEEQKDKTVPSGLWPSDHAGVAARLILRSPK
jgi:hypothetical protein